MPTTVFHPAWARPYCLVWVKWPNQAFELSSVSNATLQVHLSDTFSMLSLLLSCIGRNLYFCIQVSWGPFKPTVVYIFTISTNKIEHGTSCRQVTRLLQGPFLRGPSGWKSIQFVGAILCNMLPPFARSIHNLIFKQFISTFDLTAVEII